MTKARVVAVIGPPNVGKTTLFNRLTGLRQKVGNYSGVTVEQRSGKLKGSTATLLDLPGVWSLAPTSEDQRIAVAALFGTLKGSPNPDAVLLVVDATQLHRQQTLIDEVLATGKPTMLVINMADILAARSGHLDPLALAQSLGVPVALVSAANGNGIDQIVRFVTAAPAPATALFPILQQPAVASACSAGCAMDCRKLEQEGVYRRALPSLWSRKIDAVVLHPVFGPLLFLAIVLGVFQCIFSGAVPLSDAMQTLLTEAGNRAATAVSNAGLRSLLFDGIWASMVSILCFLPQILGLFLLISLLEDTGYMARAAVITDRTMARVGLNGRSFLPLLSAYACAVPAIMGARSIPSRRDRLTTILIAPFMTCSARLPVYTVIIAAVIPARAVLGNLLGLQAAVMLSLYAVGLLAALVTAKLLNSSVLKSAESTFAIELPEYRLPSLRSLLVTLADRAKVFLKQVGTVILALSIFIWSLAHLPLRHGTMSDLSQSYLARISQWMEPLLKPIGLNAHVGISLLTAFVARESVVSTLGTIYGRADVGPLLRGEIGLAGALSLLVFFALALQCTSTIAVVRRETNSWKWPAIQLAYMTLLAYGGAWVTFTLATHLLKA
jgi:ferrous iron transport protein B